MSDRRRSERYVVALPVLIRAGRVVESTLTANVSAHGISVFSDKQIPLREYAELELTIPGSREKAKATAMVVRSDSKLIDRAGLTQPGIAFDFYLFDASSKNIWWSFIDRLRGKSSPPADEEVTPQSLTPPPPPPSQMKSSAPPPSPVPSPPSAPAVYMINPEEVGRLWAFFRTELERRKVRIETPVLRPEGSAVELLIVHPRSAAEWVLTGEVQSASEHGRGRGPMIEIGLHEIDANTRESFRRFIASGELPSELAPTKEEEVAASSTLAAPNALPSPPAAPERRGTFSAFFDEYETHGGAEDPPAPVPAVRFDEDETNPSDDGEPRDTQRPPPLPRRGD